ncbi:MAG TPA: hypothetical protein VM120_19590 [Bryobacteraceae bacterium]|nr:hypothetical protein [Bryobacteraceae bacterium]
MNSRTVAAFGAILASVFAARLCHSRVVWVEEAYPIAAALEMCRGKTIYRDFWFDKPPLFPLFYAAFGAPTGWKLRLMGTLLVLFACWCAFLLARRFWTAREGVYAACLLAFFLTFDIPSAAIAAAPDLLMIGPHLLAILFCLRGEPFRAGLVCGAALLLNPKAPFVAAACLIWQWRHAHRIAAGIVAANLPMLGWLHWNGALPPYWEQVWRWGFLYSGDSPYAHPLSEGLRRTMNWAGFHSALLLAAAALWWQERTTRESRRLALWVLLSLGAVAAGWRFFPRYYFHLLVPMVVIAARGLVAVPRIRVAALLLLLIPLVRFGPRYAQLAAGAPWGDLALHDDAREVAALLVGRHATGILVWGYRPEVYAYSRVPAATPFLDSQPLTGVIADRHLASAEPTAPELARTNRGKLVAYDPDFIVDGLGLLNPRLAIAQYADLSHWMNRYHEVARTRYSIVYGLRTTGLWNPEERRKEYSRPTQWQ